ncbi:hypothetical protein C8F01DRAFT_1100378 [Mycena amicta]|nr:hypothetical protein C8F01DRAFT_1100378 [Mycena amicta]
MDHHLPSVAVPVTADWHKKFFKSFSPLRDAQAPVVSHSDLSDIRYIAQQSPTGHYILEREEYPTLWQHIYRERQRKLSSDYEAAAGGLVIWGQPGIGKSFFLYYALAHAISLGIYTVLSQEPSNLIVFDPRFKDPYKVLAANFDLWEPEDWALVLVNVGPHHHKPPTKFMLDESRTFVVEATSPDGGDYKKWAKQRRAELWRMGLVSKGEFQNLCFLRDTLTPSQASEAQMVSATTPAPKFYTPAEMFELLGPSLRHTIRNYFKKTDDVDADLNGYLPDFKTLFSTAANLMNALRTGHVAKEEQHENFHHYFFAFAADNINPRGYPNTGHRYVVPTRYLRDRIARTLPGKQLQDQLDAAVLFAPVPQVAGAMFESLMPQMLSKGAALVSCIFSQTNLNTVVPLNLPVSETLFDPDSTSLPVLDTLHIPKAGFPTLDAFYVYKLGDLHEVIMLQATIARRHSHVFVVPSVEIGQAVVHPYAPWGAQISRSMTIPVGYAVIELPRSFDASLAAFLARDVPDMKPEQDPVVEASTTVSGDDAPTSPAKRKPEAGNLKSEDSGSKKARVGG